MGVLEVDVRIVFINTRGSFQSLLLLEGAIAIKDVAHSFSFF